MPSYVLGATATEAQADDEVRNPDPAGRPRQVVHVTLVFDGVTCDTGDLYDALNAAYGTVAYEKNTVARGTYIFNISA